MQQQPAVRRPGVPVPGDVVEGKFRVERVLGAGGMGVVLAAWHLALERRVAIKFLLPEAAELPDAGARFLREARAAAALDGPHVARVLDVGTLDTGAAYMVLEYLTGEDLADVLETRGLLSLTEAADHLLEACEALAEAHVRGIIHRDLKPNNLFVTRRPDGTPLLKVLDFGLSKFIGVGDSVKEASLTATDRIMGSIHYMSPEQIRSLKYTDVRTDIWALGVILYRMLSGRHPFEGETMTAVTAAIMMDTPTSLLALHPDLPPAVAALVDKCLTKDPAARVQNVAEVARVLAPFATQRGRLSFESIDRLLPDLASRAGSSPGVDAPVAARCLLATPSWEAGAHDATTAPMPEGPGPMSSPGSEATETAHEISPLASPGNTTPARARRNRVALIACAAGGLVLSGLVVASRLTTSGPVDSGGPVGSSTTSEPAPAPTGTDSPMGLASPPVAIADHATATPSPSRALVTSAPAAVSAIPAAPPATRAAGTPGASAARAPRPTPRPTADPKKPPVDPGKSWD
ncbi:protein kinase domain-containing protein [Sorangium sp. So ce394]|uniref:serine/threonine-protein kinase n=1 Tax=Sorangium sp. So ce394 TaxID=3133310 RepID=UPI003F5C1674